MSTLRHDRDFAQISGQTRQLAQALDPYQRYVLLLVGMPTWCGLPFPWQPTNKLQEHAVEQFAAQGLVKLAPGTERSVILTPLGSQVAAAGLSSVLPLGEVR